MSLLSTMWFHHSDQFNPCYLWKQFSMTVYWTPYIPNRYDGIAKSGFLISPV